MPENADNPLSFWQELKRRKVIRVITVYAATSFVILELISIIGEPFGLPDWTLRFVIVILCIGLIISIILSWIYDITPEGIEKTKPVHKVTKEDKQVASNSWKVASYISFVVIVALVVLNIIPRNSLSNRNEILDKSIAVLPFKNDSPDQERMYFINGTMEAILDNLCKIKDLRVPGRTSVEQYRDNPKPIPTIAEEMNVSYILEGSGHRDGTNVRLHVQLLDGRKDQHLWSKIYDSEIEEIFSMQSEIAQTVAAEIKAIITPEEKQLIEKKPTTNLTAYDLKNFIYRIDRVLPGFANDKNTIYAPSFEMGWKKMLLNKDLETTIKRIYMGGDVTGHFRGAMQSAASGILIAKNILKIKE